MISAIKSGLRARWIYLSIRRCYVSSLLIHVCLYYWRFPAITRLFLAVCSVLRALCALFRCWSIPPSRLSFISSVHCIGWVGPWWCSDRVTVDSGCGLWKLVLVQKCDVEDTTYAGTRTAWNGTWWHQSWKSWYSPMQCHAAMLLFCVIGGSPSVKRRQ